MKYSLNNSVSPIFRSFNDVAIPVGILQSNIVGLEKWLSARFIGLHFRWYWDQVVFNNKAFYKWNCFCSKRIKIKAKTNVQFVELIKRNILNGFYLYMFINENYISNRYSYQKRNFIHDICIYGFSDEKQCFFASAYNAKYLYAHEEISYKELYEAFRNFDLPFRQLDKIKWKNRAIAFKVADNYDFKKINLTKIKKEIYRYCVSSNYGCGIEIYNYILKKLKQVKNRKINIDIRYFRVLQEHIKALSNLECGAVNYYSNNIIAENLSLKALKYTLKPDEALLIMIEKDLLKLRQNELTALKQYARKNFNGFQYKRFLKVYKRIQSGKATK